MESQSASDEWLMGQVRSGQSECLEPLVRRYAHSLLTYLERMSGDRHRAEDLFQDVFLAVWAKRQTYRFPRRFRSWLFAIATNRCRQMLRQSKPLALMASSGPEDLAVACGGPSPAELAVKSETTWQVAMAVSQLPHQQRSVLVLRTWNGLSYGEISQVLGCREATARSHMHHALAGVRRHLESQMKDSLSAQIK